MDPVVADDADEEVVVVVAAEGFDLDFEIARCCCCPLCVKLTRWGFFSSCAGGPS
jgi:hypothetical protein